MKSLAARICIVGAGPAGLSAAYYLRLRGYTRVMVIEATDRVGGKCRSITYGAHAFDLGANYVTASYAEIRKLAREFGARLYTEFDATTATISGDGTATFTNPLTAILRGRPFGGFAWALVRYFRLRFGLREVIDVPGFAGLSGGRADLCVSFLDWLRANGLEALETMFEVPLTIMGYGYLDEIAAPYALKYMSPATVWNLVSVGLGLPRRWPKRFVDGFQRFWEKVARELDVRLGMKIARIERADSVRVVLENAEVLEFDELILACPLTSAGEFLTLTEDERDLFGRIIVNPYVVTTFAIPNLRLPKRIVGMLPLPEPGRPSAITQQFADSDFVQFYTPIERGTELSKNDVVHAIRAVVTALGAVLPPRCITYDVWSYFPHVGLEDFRAGFYDRLGRLQGHAHTFYCGGIVAFESAELIVRHSKSIVERHF
jgi:hypothetical protein